MLKDLVFLLIKRENVQSIMFDWAKQFESLSVLFE